MTVRRTLTLDEAADEYPAFAEAAFARGITTGAWAVLECDHCDCGCRRYIPVPRPAPY